MPAIFCRIISWFDTQILQLAHDLGIMFGTKAFPKFKSRLKFVRRDLSRLKNKHNFAHHNLRVSLCIRPRFLLIELETLDTKSKKARPEPHPTCCQSIRGIA